MYPYITRDVASHVVESRGPSSGARGDNDVHDGSLSIYHMAPKEAKSFLRYETRMDQRHHWKVRKRRRGEDSRERRRERTRERSEISRENGERSAEAAALARWPNTCWMKL